MPNDKVDLPLSFEDAVLAQEEALRHGGGSSGILNRSAIEGALARPFHGYHDTVAVQAAALYHGLANAHGFVDANKRSAWLLMLLFLDRSGYRLDSLAGDRIDDVAVDVVTGDMSEAEFLDWLRERLVKG